MKTRLSIFISGLAIACLVACNWTEETDYKVLAPITIEVQSDTINVNTGELLEYKGMEVKTDLEAQYEWAYGRPKKGSSISDHEFERVIKISDSPSIDYVFDQIGSFILRLKVDNGESIVLKYFTLNVNAGFDEGITVLCNDAEGNSEISFIKTLTKEEQEAGKESFYQDIFRLINKNQDLRNAVDMYMSDISGNYGTFSKFMIATNDEKGRIYQLEAKTMEVLSTTGMKEEFGTYCKEFGGEKVSTSTSQFANYFLGADGKPYRYDMDLGFIAKLTEEDYHFTHAYEALFYKSNKNQRCGIWWGPDYAAGRGSASQGFKFAQEEGWEVVNVASKRMPIGRENPIYILFRSKSDPTSYKVKITTDSFRSFTDGISFHEDDLKMDQNSRMLGCKASNDVYYCYDNAIYRWGLVTAPSTEPAIRLPEGEQIRSIATNFKGKANDAGGENYLLVATFNPERSGEHKGSLYIYDFTDNSLYKSIEGKFHDPVKVMYKYRIN